MAILFPANLLESLQPERSTVVVQSLILSSLHVLLWTLTKKKIWYMSFDTIIAIITKILVLLIHGLHTEIVSFDHCPNSVQTSYKFCH